MPYDYSRVPPPDMVAGGGDEALSEARKAALTKQQEEALMNAVGEALDSAGSDNTIFSQVKKFCVTLGKEGGCDPAAADNAARIKQRLEQNRDKLLGNNGVRVGVVNGSRILGGYDPTGKSSVHSWTVIEIISPEGKTIKTIEASKYFGVKNISPKDTPVNWTTYGGKGEKAKLTNEQILGIIPPKKDGSGSAPQTPVATGAK
jgi:hypothetical protein